MPIIDHEWVGSGEAEWGTRIAPEHFGYIDYRQVCALLNEIQ